MTDPTEIIRQNKLIDRRSYPATIEINHDNDDIWIGVILSRNYILDVKWFSDLTSMQDLLTNISQTLAGKSIAQATEYLGAFSDHVFLVELAELLSKDLKEED